MNFTNVRFGGLGILVTSILQSEGVQHSAVPMNGCARESYDFMPPTRLADMICGKHNVGWRRK